MGEAQNGGAIYVVATPIGNLDDISVRALETLKKVDVIAAEDTRNTRVLLNHFGIRDKELVAYHDHNEDGAAVKLLDRVERDGILVAIVSDAGTPCIADPGYRIVSRAKARHIKVHPIPGASSLTTLISASGLPSDRFTFVGFLPSKESQIRKEIQTWDQSMGSVVFFESTRRIVQSLDIIFEFFPQAVVSVGRELTKMFEEVETLPIQESISWLKSHATLKGEAAVMVYLGSEELGPEVQEMMEESIAEKAKKGFDSGKSLKDLLKELSNDGLSRSDLYQLLLKIKSENS
jgi:16S rRNA (cytidine1402-2'-O)-methyltransferase